jgi:phosphoribosylanthranilate isomerase
MIGAKICGLTTPEAVAASLAGGATHLGFNLAPTSPRFRPPAILAALAAPARGRVRLVTVLVDPTDETLREMVAMLAPDLVQLHGAESPARVAAVRALTGRPVIKVLPVATSEDLDAAAAYEGVADHLMFDTRPPMGADRTGGHGLAFDWTLLAGRRFEHPWLLAGGLNPGNVEAAIHITAAPIVDVSSGVERSPGLKDPALIQAFLEAVRRASPTPA